MFEDMISYCHVMGLDVEVYVEEKLKHVDVYSNKVKLLNFHAVDSPQAMNNISEIFFQFISALVIPGKA